MLKENEIHLWRLDINKHNGFFQEENLFSILSASEKERADQFKFPIHRKRYIFSRAYLRILLGKYLACSPQEIEFVLGEKGKPYLPPPFSSLLFNLSHSNDLVLYGFNQQDELGVDVEWLDKAVEHEALVERFFSESEKQYFSQLSISEKKLAFFKLWVAKEAFIKAMGVGLSYPLNQFNVMVFDDHAEVAGDQIDPKKWKINYFTPKEGYMGAVASSSSEVKKLIFHDVLSL